MLDIIVKHDKFKATCKCIQCNNEYVVNNIYGARKSRVGNICNDCKNAIINVEKLTQDIARKLFIYDPDTGIVTYRTTTLRKDAGEEAGHKHVAGYKEIKIGKERILLHRFIFLYQEGYLPEQVDHINHNKMDNRWENLRAVNNTVNSMNCSVSKNSSTKINGVSFIPTLNKYRAYITVNRKQKHLGVFTDIDDAIKVRQEANSYYGFHENHGV